jgi:hypothetical protein
MKDKRDKKIVNAITTNSLEYKGVTYKSLTTRTMLLLEKFDSPFFHGGAQLKGLLDFLYISSHDPKEVERIKPEDFDSVIYDFADTLTPEDLKNLGELAENLNKDSGSTIVDAIQDEKKQ